MKRETIFKTILILMVGVILFTMPVNVFASDAADLGSLFEDQGTLEDLEGDETTELTPETPSTETNTQPEESLPHAGVAEDTMMVVTIVGLVILATVAYKKINEYENI